MLDIVGFEHRTTQLVGALDVRGTSVQRGPKRSVDRIPDVSLKCVSLGETFFNARHRRVRTLDNVVTGALDREKYLDVFVFFYYHC